MLRRILLPALVGLALAACGPGATDATDTAPTGTGPETTPCPSFATDCEDQLPPDTVELRGILFRPDELTVSAGTTVTFVNQDTVDHTVTAGTPDDPRPDQFDATLATQGDEVEITFDDPGEVAYFCRIHKKAMVATIVVE